MSRELLQRSLNMIDKLTWAIEKHLYIKAPHDAAPLMEALRQELAKPEQEPVIRIRIKNGCWINTPRSKNVKSLPDGLHDLYTAPPRKQWVSLTDEDMRMLVDQARKVSTEIPCQDHNERLLTLAGAKLKELNG